MHCVNPTTTLFNDLDEKTTQQWMSILESQPAGGYGGTTDYSGWKEVPSVYLICEKDQLLPEGLQVQFAEVAGSRIERCEAGHMVMLSMPEKVIELIKSVVAELS